MRSRYILIFAIVSFLVLLGAGGLILKQLSLSQQFSKEVNSSYESLLDLEIILSQAKDVETGTRGYLLTRDSAYLIPYFTGRDYLRSQMVPVLARERYQPGMDAYHIALMDSLKTSIDVRLATASRLIERVSMDSAFGKQQFGLLVRGRESMDRARAYVTEIRTYRETILHRQTQYLYDYLQNVPIYVSLLAGIALMILAILFYALTEQLRKVSGYRDTLESGYAELRTAYEDLGRYNTLANHHLKEPVRKMLLFIDRQRIKYGDSMTKPESELIQKMDELTRHIYLLLEDLSLISELDVRGLPKKLPIELKELMSGLLLKMRPEIDAAKATVTMDETLPVVRADAEQLGFVIQHLLENAFKFARPGAPLHIELNTETSPPDPTTEKARLSPGVRNVCRISISDNGLGIPEEYHDRIFQLFFQVNEAGKTLGTGLGLALCQKIARQHGGFITMRSRENQGSTFTLVLPS